MYKSVFKIPKMDCPSEENMIKMKLEGLPEIKKLQFDLENRVLTVYHDKKNPEIEKRLDELDLGSQLVERELTENKNITLEHKQQTKLLWAVLIINFSFFVIEMTTGLISRSMGLVADSLDMLADATVYGLSLWAVGSTIVRKKRVARLSGYFQILLALLGFVEVIRRFIEPEALPGYTMMIVVSVFALVANAASLFILQKSKSDEAHIKASMIFTSNDIIINIGVIIAGILVFVTHSKYPDLIIGAIVFFIVVRGAVRILKLGK